MMLAIADTTRAQVQALGVMGDSISDEYREETYSYALGWIEQLVVFRHVDVGLTASEAGQAGSTWGEPRRTGYAFNWARAGATSASLLSQGQHTGLAAQMGAAGPNHAILAIGQNDFLPYPLPGYAYYEIYNNRWTSQRIDQHIAGITANIEAAMAAILAADGYLVLANVVDYGIAPAVWRSLFFGDPNKRDRVTAVISRLNDELAQITQVYDLTLVDLFGFSKAIFGSNHDLREFLYIGDKPIALWESDTAAHGNPHAGFVHDGVHPGTHLQGLLGNLFLAALNIGHDAQVALFSESEILSQAGLAYGGTDTLTEQLGHYSDYVWDFSLGDPIHDLDRDDDVDIHDFSRFQTCFALTGDPIPQGCKIADFNVDGRIGLKDFVEFSAAIAGPS